METTNEADWLLNDWMDGWTSPDVGSLFLAKAKGYSGDEARGSANVPLFAKESRRLVRF